MGRLNLATSASCYGPVFLAASFFHGRLGFYLKVAFSVSAAAAAAAVAAAAETAAAETAETAATGVVQIYLPNGVLKRAPPRTFNSLYVVLRSN